MIDWPTPEHWSTERFINYPPMCVGMATKNISITEEAYRRLASFRKERESFSHVITRLTSNAGRLLKFAGSLSHEEADRLMERIKENRDRWIKEEAKKREELRRALHGVS